MKTNKKIMVIMIAVTLAILATSFVSAYKLNTLNTISQAGYSLMMWAPTSPEQVSINSNFEVKCTFNTPPDRPMGLSDRYWIEIKSEEGESYSQEVSLNVLKRNKVLKKFIPSGPDPITKHYYCQLIHQDMKYIWDIFTKENLGRVPQEGFATVFIVKPSEIVHYTCRTTDYQCIQDQNGQYLSIDDCKATCIKPPTTTPTTAPTTPTGTGAKRKTARTAAPSLTGDEDAIKKYINGEISATDFEKSTR
jgi:hypothetical protein